MHSLDETPVKVQRIEMTEEEDRSPINSCSELPESNQHLRLVYINHQMETSGGDL
jgi:hypothetical protein